MVVATQEVGSSTIGSDVRSALDQAPTRPTMGAVVRSIRDEACAKGYRCNRRQAWELYLLLRDAVVKARRSRYYRCQHVLSPRQYLRVHALLDVIMPDDTAPQPGSAHEVIQLSLLRGRELAIIHTKDAADECVLDLRLEMAG